MYIWCWPLMLDPWPNFGLTFQVAASSAVPCAASFPSWPGGTALAASSRARRRPCGRWENWWPRMQWTIHSWWMTRRMARMAWEVRFVQLELLGRQPLEVFFWGSHMFLTWKDHKNRLVEEVTHMVLAIQQMMKEANGGKEGPLLDLADWKSGRYCALDVELTQVFIYYIHTHIIYIYIT